LDIVKISKKNDQVQTFPLEKSPLEKLPFRIKVIEESKDTEFNIETDT